MSPDAQTTLLYLQLVAAERDRLRADPTLAARVMALKLYQNRRFERTYADLLAGPDTGIAARFFLDDLYGAKDFTARDEQFGRIVGPLDKLFPARVVRTVRDLAELHALSERLDRHMAEVLGDARITPSSYVEAWCRVGEAANRERQITMMTTIGGALVHYTRDAWLRRSLRLMRTPARLAGLEALHGFLERGYDSFAAMREPQAFLDTIAARERALGRLLFTRPARWPDDLPPA